MFHTTYKYHTPSPTPNNPLPTTPNTDINTSTRNTTMTHPTTPNTTTTNPCSYSYASTSTPSNTYDHDHVLPAYTNPNHDMTRRRLLEVSLLTPLPPTTPYDHLCQAPPKPPPMAPPPHIDTPHPQEPPLPDSPDPDVFYLPGPDDSDYDADSTTDSDSDSLTLNDSFLTSLPHYGKLDDLDELNPTLPSYHQALVFPTILLPSPIWLGAQGLFNQQALPQVI